MNRHDILVLFFLSLEGFENNNYLLEFLLFLFLVTETIWSSNKPKVEVATTAAPTPLLNEKCMQLSSNIKNDPNNFFTFRDGVVERAVKECIAQFLDVETEGPVHAYFLLTQYVLQIILLSYIFIYLYIYNYVCVCHHHIQLFQRFLIML